MRTLVTEGVEALYLLTQFIQKNKPLPYGHAVGCCVCTYCHRRTYASTPSVTALSRRDSSPFQGEPLALSIMDILYSDSQIVVCVKPVGLDSEIEVPAQLGGEIFPIHRLDKNVGGLMVYAKTKQAAAALSKAVQEGSMVKEYVAMVHGCPPESGDWEDFLFKDSTKNKVFVVKKERRGVKKARLEFVRLKAGDTSLVRIRLHTGRSHQIRVQFASRGFPLVGDHKYGSRDGAEAPMLFSCALTFPYKGKAMHFERMPGWAEAVHP